MDFEKYKHGALGLVGLAVLIIIINLFGSPEQNNKDSIINIHNLLEVPVDDSPTCVVHVPLEPPSVFTSAPDPNGIDVRHVFDRLVEYDRRTGQFVPGLATHWEISDDRRVYTFTLRKHVNFHSISGYTPKRAFNASDVLFSFSRLVVDSNPFYNPDSIATKDYKTVDMTSLIESISRRDTHVIEFSLTVPYPRFISNLTMDFASIQSKEYAEAMNKAGTPNKFFTHPVGTGPFAVTEQRHPKGNGQILYSANMTYWGNYVSKGQTAGLKRQMVPQEIIGTD